jgi:hypothetical protein
VAENPAFVSVKLPAELVNQAREASQTMRRSVASQVEYWATLGRALEHAGLTTSDSQALIARQERAPYTLAPLLPAACRPTWTTCKAMWWRWPSPARWPTAPSRPWPPTGASAARTPKQPDGACRSCT